MNTTETHKLEAPEGFAQRLLDWYRVNARKMPWRIPPHEHANGVRPDPYHVWLSEVMLQQTQVATVRDYFLKFKSRWPTVSDLAKSDLEDVLKGWAGLGYYSRARNLKKCSEEIVQNHNAEFPKGYESLKKLPGIGDYTASAIASIAFDEPVAVVDGNVERVIARHRRIEAFFPEAKQLTKNLLNEVLDRETPGEFAQAIMDLGATICTPKRPSCSLCPVNDDCIALTNGDVESFPLKRPKPIKPTRKGAAFVMRNKRGEIFLMKREEHGLLGQMTQVPTTNWTSRRDGQTESSAGPVMADWKKQGIAKHTFTHFHLQLTVWLAEDVDTVPVDGWWCSEQDLLDEALPTAMKKVLALALNS